MKPMIVVPPDVMDADNLKMLRDNDICVVVAKNPAQLHFMDPLPAASNRTQIENAAIQLSRRLLNETFNSTTFYKSTFAALFIEILIKGSPLDPRGTTEEQYDRMFNQEKAEEIARLAREEARAERKAKKAKLLAAKTESKP
jgi:hypothetical protein